jgi:N-acetylmuramoyl-L-alanine amidase
MTLILSEATADGSRVAHNVAQMRPHGRFVDEMMPTLWLVAELYGINPVGMIAQSGKETGWGHFMGKVPPTFFNTCGLKIHNPKLAGDQDGTMAHAQFASWETGAHAHAQHLYAYLQMTWGKGEDIVPLMDPRWVHVYGKREAIRDWEQLSGTWAYPGVTYGQEIVGIMDKLSGNWTMP